MAQISKSMAFLTLFLPSNPRFSDGYLLRTLLPDDSIEEKIYVPTPKGAQLRKTSIIKNGETRTIYIAFFDGAGNILRDKKGEYERHFLNGIISVYKNGKLININNMKSRFEKIDVATSVILVLSGSVIKVFATPQCDGNISEECPSEGCTWRPAEGQFRGCDGSLAKAFSLGGTATENSGKRCGREQTGTTIGRCYGNLASEIQYGTANLGNTPVCDKRGGE